MLIQEWMTKDVITVEEKDSLQKAVSLMKEHSIRLLPVMRGKKLVGILSDGDIKKASIPDLSALDVQELLYRSYQLKVEDIMTKNPITVPTDCTIEEAAEVLLNNKINGVPVIDPHGEVAGIITQTDMFKVIVSLSGMGAKGVLFGFYLRDRSGAIKEVTDIIRSYGGSLASILSSYENSPPGYRQVHIRAINLDRQKLPQIVKQFKETAKLRYMVDYSTKRREIFPS
jgi:acetoin utilization protein AcuB